MPSPFSVRTAAEYRARADRISRYRTWLIEAMIAKGDLTLCQRARLDWLEGELLDLEDRLAADADQMDPPAQVRRIPIARGPAA